MYFGFDQPRASFKPTGDVLTSAHDTKVMLSLFESFPTKYPYRRAGALQYLRYTELPFYTHERRLNMPHRTGGSGARRGTGRGLNRDRHCISRTSRRYGEQGKRGQVRGRDSCRDNPAVSEEGAAISGVGASEEGLW